MHIPASSTRDRIMTTEQVANRIDATRKIKQLASQSSHVEQVNARFSELVTAIGHFAILPFCHFAIAPYRCDPFSRKKTEALIKETELKFITNNNSKQKLKKLNQFTKARINQAENTAKNANKEITKLAQQITRDMLCIGKPLGDIEKAIETFYKASLKKVNYETVKAQAFAEFQKIEQESFKQKIDPLKQQLTRIKAKNLGLKLVLTPVLLPLTAITSICAFIALMVTALAYAVSYSHAINNDLIEKRAEPKSLSMGT